MTHAMYTRTTVACLISLCCMLPALAQTPATPSTENMIEQLKAPRTRSLRNLLVEEVRIKTEPAPGAEVPAPAGEASSTTTTAAAGPPASQPVASGAVAATSHGAPASSRLMILTRRFSGAKGCAALASSPAPLPDATRRS